ncbi:SufD family Fe-S cluster assembly protein [Henriciella sp. AS95]|uniref:SufB/SufD family protein n=1 Tax=Henriciella sp. AS95 TaxID=3135782 RepID=UPI00316C88E2
MPELVVPGRSGTEQKISFPDDAAILRFDGENWKVPQSLPEGISVYEKEKAQGVGEAKELPLGALTASMTGQPVKNDVLMIEVTAEVAAPLYFDFDERAAELAFTRLAIVVRSGCSISTVERYAGSAGFSSVLLEFGLQDGASVDRTIVQRGTKDQAVGVTTTATLEKGASFEQTALGFGAKVSRVETHVDFAGTDASATINSAYLVGDGYHMDFTSHVRHGAESCTTRQLTKGAVAKGGRGVFQGKFLVPRTVGQFTDANMQHQALLLESGAEVFAKPELEIYADDVECEHGNTSGQLDEAALFYMRQRGIPANQARALLIEAFVIEALEGAHPSVRESMIEAARAFLRQQG